MGIGYLFLHFSNESTVAKPGGVYKDDGEPSQSSIDRQNVPSSSGACRYNGSGLPAEMVEERGLA